MACQFVHYSSISNDIYRIANTLCHNRDAEFNITPGAIGSMPACRLVNAK